MNESLQLFFNTLAIIGGIGIPIYIFMLLASLRQFFEWRHQLAKFRYEDKQKMPPYQKIELFRCPNPDAFWVRITKDDKTIFEQGASKP